MRLGRSGQNAITNIRTVHARSDFAKQITDESMRYLNEDKKRTRKWFQVCGNLNVPLEGTKFGFIYSIPFLSDKVNGNPLPKSGKASAEVPGQTQTEPLEGRAEIGETGQVEISKGPSAMEKKQGLAFMLGMNVAKISDMEPVAKLTGREMNDKTKKPSEQIKDFFESVGNSVIRTGFGKIELNDYGVGGVINHRPLNRAKMEHFKRYRKFFAMGAKLAMLIHGREEAIEALYLPHRLNWEGKRCMWPPWLTKTRGISFT